MIYRVTHKTKYGYADAVSLSHNIVRMRPREHAAQTCRWYELFVSPTPTVNHEGFDYFGNHVSWLSLQEPHVEFTVEAVSEVEVRLELRPDLSLSAPWEDVGQKLLGAIDPGLIAVRQFTFDSYYVKRSPLLVAYAIDSFPPGRPLLECVLDLTLRIRRDFRYLPGSTKVGTPILEVLQMRKGVCQDFAHLEIACLRSLGLASRYVSGYLASRVTPGKPRMVGADVSHAWISVFTPDFGWVDFDPTNGMMPLDSHVTVAWGRDYDDVGPIRGILIGGQRQKLDVGVDVLPVENVS